MEERRSDSYQFGVINQKVDDYQRKLDAMERKMDKMEQGLEHLIALANQGRGGFWMGMLLVSCASAVTGWAIHWITGK
jgi:hypothetical protein